MAEALREAACVGNLLAVENILKSGVNVNSQHAINGWTALHWACKRNHTSIIQYLLDNGADVSIETSVGENALKLASSEEALTLLGCPREDHARILKLRDHPTTPPIIPHYLQNPPFPYQDIQEEPRKSVGKVSKKPFGDTELANGLSIGDTVDAISEKDSHREAIVQKCSSPLLLKVRLSGSDELDFVEIEVKHLTYQVLLEACAEELEIDISCISKIRKLPDVLIRKDRDVERMNEGQKLEVIIY